MARAAVRSKTITGLATAQSIRPRTILHPVLTRSCHCWADGSPAIASRSSTVPAVTTRWPGRTPVAPRLHVDDVAEPADHPDLTPGELLPLRVGLNEDDALPPVL